MSEIRKCRIENGRVLMCEALDAVAEYEGQGTRYQGVKVKTVVSMGKEGYGFSRHLIVLKGGEHSKRGIVMNFCPFCAEPILPEPASSSEAA